MGQTTQRSSHLRFSDFFAAFSVYTWVESIKEISR